MAVLEWEGAGKTLAEADHGLGDDQDEHSAEDDEAHDFAEAEEEAEPVTKTETVKKAEPA